MAASGSCCLQLDRGADGGNKIFLHDSIQWCFLADFVCEPFGFDDSPGPRERESQNHSVATLQFALERLLLGFVRLDYPARLSRSRRAERTRHREISSWVQKTASMPAGVGVRRSQSDPADLQISIARAETRLDHGPCASSSNIRSRAPRSPSMNAIRDLWILSSGLSNLSASA